MNHLLFADPVSEIKSNPRLSVIHNSNFSRHQYRKLKKGVLPATALTLFVLALLFMTFVQVGSFIQGYAIARLEKEQDQALRQLQALKLEEAVLKRPERVRKMALHELGLIPASKAPIIRAP
jgi:hypothetical protein